jgi:hypothetical protein
MKILAPVSSRRRKGNTARIVQMIEGHMKAVAARQREPLEFETLYLSGSYDYAYWEKQGWLVPERTFYVAHRASRIKVALARLVGAVVARFMLG